MKWFLIIILIFIVMLIANAVSEQYKDKYDFYNNLKNFLHQLKINVSFKKEKIPEFLNKITCKKQFKLFINEYKNYLNSGSINLNSIKVLEDDEKAELCDIVLNLGKYNTENETKQLNGYLELVEQKLVKAQQDKNKLCPMILKLSLLFSIALAIILI